MSDKLQPSVSPNKERVVFTTVLAFCAALGCCDEVQDKREAIMSIVDDDGTAMNCPVDVNCAEGKNFDTGLHACIDFSRCDPPMK